MTKQIDNLGDLTPEPICFVATVEKVQTMANTNQVRVWLDLPETALYEMARLAECKVRSQVLNVVATPGNLTELDDEAEKEAKGSSSQVDRRRIGER